MVPPDIALAISVDSIVGNIGIPNREAPLPISKLHFDEWVAANTSTHPPYRQTYEGKHVSTRNQVANAKRASNFVDVNTMTASCP